MGQNYGGSGIAAPGTQGLGGHTTTGTSGAASGLNREMEQAFSTTGQTGTGGPAGTSTGTGQTTFYDSATR